MFIISLAHLVTPHFNAILIVANKSQRGLGFVSLVQHARHPHGHSRMLVASVCFCWQITCTVHAFVFASSIGATISAVIQCTNTRHWLQCERAVALAPAASRIARSINCTHHSYAHSNTPLLMQLFNFRMNHPFYLFFTSDPLSPPSGPMIPDLFS